MGCWVTIEVCSSVIDQGLLMARKRKNPMSEVARSGRGRERAAAFAAGATPLMWSNGGARVWTQKNGRAVAAKTACRGTHDGR